MAKETQFNSLDIEELAAYLVGYEESDACDLANIEEKLIEKFGIDLRNFHLLIQKLAPLLDMAISPLTETPFIGFGDGECWIAKKPFPGFINQVLIWLSADQIKAGKARVCERIIKAEGKPEFKILLMKADQDCELKSAPPHTGKEGSDDKG